MTAWLTAKDVAEDLGFATTTIREWCKDGVFPGAQKWPDGRPRSEWRIPQAAVETHKRKQTEPRAIPRDRLDELMSAALAKSA